MVVSEIDLYNILKAKFGDQEAQSVVQGIKSAVKDEFDNKKDVLATKQDLMDLRIEMEKNRSDLIKWMFIFWIGQLAAFTAIAKFVLHQ